MSVSADRGSWIRLAAVAVWAIAFAFVEAMVVYYLRKLFALEYDLRFVPADFHFPPAYLPYEQAREAATMVMLLAGRLRRRPHLAAAVRLLALRLRRLGHLLLRVALRAAGLAVVAGHARPSVPHAGRVVGAHMAARAGLLRLHRRGSSDPGAVAERLALSGIDEAGSSRLWGEFGGNSGANSAAGNGSRRTR